MKMDQNWLPRNGRNIFCTITCFIVNYYRSQSHDIWIYIQIQRQRCSRLERFWSGKKYVTLSQNALCYLLRCTFFQRCRCNSRSQDWLDRFLNTVFVRFLMCTRVARWFIFKPKIPISGKFWMVLKWKVLVYFMALRFVLRPFGIFFDHLVYFGFVWYIFSRFGILCEEKSGNTDWVHSVCIN
jgi:hypothetical protein